MKRQPLGNVNFIMNRCAALAPYLFLAFAVAASANDQNALDGVWLPDRVELSKSSKLPLVWKSTLTIKDGSFALARYWNLPKDTTGTFTIGTGQHAGQIDLQTDAVDLSPIGAALQYPASKLPGIFKLGRDRLTICFGVGDNAIRPTNFLAENKRTVLVELVRAASGFKEFPKQVTIKVLDDAGEPAGGLEVFDWMTCAVLENKPADWTYNGVGKTDGAGVIRLPYTDRLARLSVRNADNTRMSIAIESPASLADGEATLTLKPTRKIRGSITSQAFADAKRPIGWTNTYLYFAGERIADYSSRTGGAFEFTVPAGDYILNPYGQDLPGDYVPIGVPPDAAEFVVPPIELAASSLVNLIGKPAPELEDVVGWSGKPVKLADLKGRVVLLDFWGYWCSPCVAGMPDLIALQEQFAEKGLVIVGVHRDAGDGIDTAEKLAPKLVGSKTKYWNDKDLPFPSALVPEREVRTLNGITYDCAAAAQYGVSGYPTTILIDRAGKVVGEFHANNREKAATELEKALAAPVP